MPQHPAFLLALYLCAAAPAGAADMTFTPAPGSGVVIHSVPSAPALQVLPSGGVRLPGLPATPATATSTVCHNAACTLSRCGPQTGVGQKGDKGEKGEKGDPGAAGAPGPAGPQGAVAGVEDVRHGCFNGTYSTSEPLHPVTFISGSGYTVAPALHPSDTKKRVYFIFFTYPPGGRDTTVLLDVRSSSGHSLPVTVERPNWVDLLLQVDVNSLQELETFSVCFMLMR